MTDVNDEEWIEELVADIRQRHLTRDLGQVTCPRPHVYLFVEGSRCHCGAEV
jgi:hypothetical protein